jgi:hypothetical protein
LTLLSYTDFLLETYADVNVSSAKRRLLIASAKQMGASVLEMESLEFFINEGFVNDLFDIATDINEASFAERFKEMALRAKDKIKEKGKAALDKIGDAAKAAVKFGGSIMAPLKAILGKIVDVVKKAWEKAKEAAASAVSATKEKILEKIKPMLKDGEKRKSIADEVKNINQVAKAGTNWIADGFVSAMSKSAAKTATADESRGYIKSFEYAFIESAAILIENGYPISKIKEELLVLEGGSEGGLNIPFVTTVIKKISDTPPFSWFHKIEHSVADKVEGGLNRFSAFMTKVAGAPGPFTFPVLAGLVGIAAGYLAETSFKKSLISLEGILGFGTGLLIPGWGILIKVIKYTGLALAVHGVISQLVGQDKKDDEDKKDETSSDKPEESEE